MKTRAGFVSNSSSSSFVIPKDKLTQEQINLILSYENDGSWDVGEKDNIVYGSTSSHRFNMEQYLENIGINSKHIIWKHS